MAYPAMAIDHRGDVGHFPLPFIPACPYIILSIKCWGMDSYLTYEAYIHECKYSGLSKAVGPFLNID